MRISVGFTTTLYFSTSIYFLLELTIGIEKEILLEIPLTS